MIAIIVPYYNAEPWIDRCCKSLTNAEGDFAFVMVNDQSTDNSESIVEKYAYHDERFRVLRTYYGKGVSAARNFGIVFVQQLLDAEWITFLDADDEIKPDAYKAYMTAIGEGIHNFYQMDHIRYYDKINKETVKYRGKPGVYALGMDAPECFCMVWNKLYRTSFLGTEIRFKEGLQYGEDELFNYECMAKDPVMMVTNGTAVIHHYSNPNSLTKTRRAEDLMTQMRALEDFMMESDDPQMRAVICNLMSDYWSSLTFLDTFCNKTATACDK